MITRQGIEKRVIIFIRTTKQLVINHYFEDTISFFVFVT